jgi:hypothetical protein
MPVFRELGRGGGLGALASLDFRVRCVSGNFDLELDQELHGATAFLRERVAQGPQRRL